MSKKYKVNNAIILAAGRGSRLNELTKNIPKPLLNNKNGIPLIEDIIMKIQEKGINDIYIVVGYKAEMFNYLESKYKIKLVLNSKWENSNNISSIKVVLENLGNSLIVNGDIIMNENVIENSYNSSITYAERNEDIDEWIILENNKNNIRKIEKIGKDKKGFYQREICFLTNELVKNMNLTSKSMDKDEYYEFWVLKTSLKYNIDFKIFEIKKDIVTDIDNIKEYKRLTGF